ncbi:MAG: imidazolonepropionase [Bacteriovoracaceae bacterium]|nr:imidazolonepropionase [Bacteriovoracaceae bacterium]
MSLFAYRNCSQILSLRQAHAKDGRNLLPEDLSIIDNAAVVFSKDKIIWVGPESKFPSEYADVNSKDLTGHILLPELVDSHTHLIFGGDRATEYTMRLNGADYVEIANAGGGILNTMVGTNKLSSDELFAICKDRIERINSYGVGTIEIKSGYGLNYEKEYELSHLIHQLKIHFSDKIQIFNTFMAAHAVPSEFETSYQYMTKVVIPLLTKLAQENFIDAVDIFHEQNYFDSSDVTLLFETANKLGIALKSHVDEFNDNKGATLAAQYNCLSADHLLMTGSDGVEALANSTTVATLLPGTGFFLGKKQANARALLDAGVKVAIASDYNPGSCHFDNVLLIASMAAPQYKMNSCELYAALTLNAAHALGLQDQGAIIPDLKPRFSIFSTPKVDNLTYSWGKNFNKVI